MKGEPAVTTAKSPHGRFMEIGRKIMTTPKSDVDAKDAAWREERKVKIKHGVK